MAKSTQEVESVESIKVRITPEAVLEAQRYRIDNPIIYALQQATSTLWRISDCGVALEVTPPYRSCVVGPEVLAALRDYQANGTMPTCEFNLELKSGTA